MEKFRTWLVATTVMTSTLPKAPTKTMTPNTSGTKMVVKKLKSRPKRNKLNHKVGIKTHSWSSIA